MAIGTPLHPRTAPLCKSHDWRQWSGYLAADSYDDFVQPEYAAIRHAAALIDVSPLYKYRVRGADAVGFVNRVFTHDLAAVEVNSAIYTPWCDSDGKVRQEGTVFRLADDVFQINAAEPALRWLHQNARGYAVEITDRSTDTAALSLQGPRSRDVLLEAAGAGVKELKFFHITHGEIAGAPVTISRTGYTGDLGFEIWPAASDAVRVWDALMKGGAPHNITPCGLKAMDLARVEAGFVLINVDYISAESALVESDKASPFELGLGWAVKLDKPHFIGRSALAAEKATGTARMVVGLEIGWEPLERLYAQVGRMPDLPLIPCREPVPVYSESGGQIGRATSRVWSTLLKKYIALATVERRFASPGTHVDMEVTVQYERQRAPATVVKPRFYRPERMRA